LGGKAPLNRPQNKLDNSRRRDPVQNIIGNEYRPAGQGDTRRYAPAVFQICK
jgi:hypothetical protein